MEVSSEVTIPMETPPARDSRASERYNKLEIEKKLEAMTISENSVSPGDESDNAKHVAEDSQSFISKRLMERSKLLSMARNKFSAAHTEPRQKTTELLVSRIERLENAVFHCTCDSMTANCNCHSLEIYELREHNKHLQQEIFELQNELIELKLGKVNYKPKDYRVLQQLQQLSNQENTYISSVNGELSRMDLDIKAMGKYITKICSTLLKLSKLTNLPQDMLENIATIDVWQRKVMFRIERLEGMPR